MTATIGMGAMLALLLFIFSPPPPPAVLAVFNDEDMLAEVQRAQDNPTFAGLPVASMERIFAHPNGPFHQAMNALPRHYLAVLFTAFHEHFALQVFPQQFMVQRGPLCAMLKDFRLAPDFYLPQVHPSVNIRYTNLNLAWMDYQRNRLVTDGAFWRERPHLDADAQVTVPYLLKPLLLTPEVLRPDVVDMAPTTRRYGDLEHLFFQVYVAHYLEPGGNQRRMAFFFTGLVQNQPQPTLRMAVLRALFWVLVVRPFLYLIVDNPGLNQALLQRQPPIDYNQLIPFELFDPRQAQMFDYFNEGDQGEEEANPGPAFEFAHPDPLPDIGLAPFDAGPGGGGGVLRREVEAIGGGNPPPPLPQRPRPNQPAEVVIQWEFEGGEGLNPAEGPRGFPSLAIEIAIRGGRNGAFGDENSITAFFNQLQARQLFDPTVEAVDRFYDSSHNHLNRRIGPLQQAMITEDRFAAFVMFTVFQEQFAVAFAGDGNGAGSRFLQLFKDLFLLPQSLFRMNMAGFPALRLVWNAFLDMMNNVARRPLREGEWLVPVPRGQVERAAAAPIAVPRLFRPLLIVGWEEAMATEVLPYEAVWNRFVTVYVDRFPDHGDVKRTYFNDVSESRQTRRSHVRALYWLLVVRPFQEVIRQNQDRFRNIDPDTLTPEDVGGGGGGGGGHGPGPGGPGGGGGPVGAGGAGRGGAGGGGGVRGGHLGGGGEGGGGGNLPPPPPPQNPRRPLPNILRRPQPAPAQPSSSSTSGSQPQQGTCSAKSAPGADDRGSPSPPSKKHKPDGPSEGPGRGAGGGSGGMAV